MVRAALAALALAVCARADQYGAGAMPQYGAADYERDYYARSPDAPAPLNYKYQEEPHGDSEKPTKFTEEVDRWRKSSGRVQRRPTQDDTDDDLELERKALELEERSGRRRRKRRGRGRRDESRHEELPEPVRRSSLVLPADQPATAGSHSDHYLDSIDYREVESKYLEDNELIPFRETTVKVITRKPRHRVFVPPPLPESTPAKAAMDIVDEDEEKIVRSMKDELKDDSDYGSGEERDRLGALGQNRLAPLGRARPTLPSSDRELGPGFDNEDTMRDWRPSKPDGNYPDYNDYRSMKSMENIKKKLPTLLRRPTPTTTSQWPRRLFSAGRVPMWPGRRAGELALPSQLQLTASTIEQAATVPAFEPIITPASNFGSEVGTELHAPYNLTVPAAYAATLIATSTNTVSTNNATYSPVAFVPSGNKSELSMAEKSRLSILKKAQKKESAGKEPARKPLVLLQVTTLQTPTVVMVMPQSGDPWQRAREVVGDSPATLRKVKRLMRQKFIAQAKNIRDITDNWDETVCDYIDVGMLDSLPDDGPRPPAPLPLLASACFLCLILVL